MKKNMILFVVIILLAGAVGCEDKTTQYEIYENHDISACGIEDPLRNIEWLAEFIVINKESVIMHLYRNYDIMIHLYLNNETQEENIVISFNLIEGEEKSKHESVDPYSLKQVFSCLGERLFVDDSGETNSDEWDDFFYSGRNKLQGIIWYRKRIN